MGLRYAMGRRLIVRIRIDHVGCPPAQLHSKPARDLRRLEPDLDRGYDRTTSSAFEGLPQERRPVSPWHAICC